MDETHVIAADLARVYDRAETAGRKLLATLAWGDKVKVVEQTSTHVKIELITFGQDGSGGIVLRKKSGFITAKPARVIGKLSDNRVLKVDFIDVQQGDGAVLETPQGKVMLIDGGDNKLFARYLAARFPGTANTAEGRKTIDCILVTHGDADHFVGLTHIPESETHPEVRKRLFIQPRRVFHNGIVKRPSGRPDQELFGASVKKNGRIFITELEGDLITTSAEMNRPFRKWRTDLKRYRDIAPPLEVSRLQFGDGSKFDFLSEDEPQPISVQVLGPITTLVNGNPALPMLSRPGNVPRLDERDGSLDLESRPPTSVSASHTINGHSVVLLLQYGNFRFLLTGDLNEETEAILTNEHDAGRLSLEADVLKVPHHGSADFNPEFLRAVAPVVSLVSSGDESKQKEYIHPRANLMGSLGRYSRLERPLIFVTELVAFFEVVGLVSPKEADDGGSGAPPKRFFAFQRTAFGMVKIRTDGERMLVYTNSGQARLKEAYAFTKDAAGTLTPSKVAQV